MGTRAAAIAYHNLTPEQKEEHQEKLKKKEAIRRARERPPVAPEAAPPIEAAVPEVEATEQEDIPTPEKTEREKLEDELSKEEERASQLGGFGLVRAGRPEMDKGEPAQTRDEASMNRYIEGYKLLQKEDRETYKNQYDKLLAERKKGLSNVAWQELLGTFLNSLSDYAAAAYAQKENIDMSGAKLHPKTDWKTKRAAVEREMDIALNQLGKVSSMKRSDAREEKQAEFTSLSLIRQEHQNIRRLRVRQSELNQRLKIADTSREQNIIRQKISHLDKLQENMQKRMEKAVKDRKDRLFRENTAIDKAVDKIKTNYNKDKNEEDAFENILSAFQSKGVLSAAVKNDLIQDEGWMMESTFKNTYLPALEQWREMHDAVAIANPQANDLQIQKETLRILKQDPKGKDSPIVKSYGRLGAR